MYKLGDWARKDKSLGLEESGSVLFVYADPKDHTFSSISSVIISRRVKSEIKKPKIQSAIFNTSTNSSAQV
jgi:hypothetical protein